MAEQVTVQDPHGFERRVPKGAVKFFVNKETEAKVLDSAGRVNAKATAAAQKEV